MPVNVIKPSSSSAKSFTLSFADFALPEWPLESEVLAAMKAAGAGSGDSAQYETPKSVDGNTIRPIVYTFKLLDGDTVYILPMPKPEYKIQLLASEVREGSVWVYVENGTLLSHICTATQPEVVINQYAPNGIVIPALVIESEQYYGNPVAAIDNIANGHIIDPVSHRFQASQSSKIVEQVMWWRAGDDGPDNYSAGTGGSYRLEIQGDINGKPDGIMQGSPAFYTPDVVALPEGEVKLIAIDGPVTERGKTYHNVITNLDPDPDNNYVSFNGVHYTSTSQKPEVARPEESILRTLYFHSLGGATQDWIDYPNSGAPTVFYMPLFIIGYENGFYDGENNQYGQLVTTQPKISGVNKCRAVMDFARSGSSTSFRALVKRNAGTDSLTVKINGVSQQMSGITSEFGWHEVPFTDGIVEGDTYLVEFECPASSEFEISGARPINPAWKSPRLFNGLAESSNDDGVTWNKTDTDAFTLNHFSVYFKV